MFVIPFRRACSVFNRRNQKRLLHLSPALPFRVKKVPKEIHSVTSIDNVKKQGHHPVNPTTDPQLLSTTLQTSAASLSSSSPKIKLKERLITFYTAMWRDYRDVFQEAYKESKEKPMKASFYFILLGGMGYLIWSNPDERDFDETYFQNRTKLSLVGQRIRNPTSEEFTVLIGKLKIKRELRYQSFGLFSVVWKHDNSPDVGIYEATCKYLKPLFREARERVIDIGFGNRWWMFEERMKDYDVNEREWELADIVKANQILEKVDVNSA